VSDLITAPTDPQDVVEAPGHVVEAVRQPPVVITEQEVAFSTAAAAALPREKPAPRVIARLHAMLRHSSEFANPSEGAMTVPHHYPARRDEFLEDAAMAREMGRL
jgi:hypothetical protein